MAIFKANKYTKSQEFINKTRLVTIIAVNIYFFVQKNKVGLFVYHVESLRVPQFVNHCCNQWGKARESSEPIFICSLPWWTLNPAGISQGGMHCGKCGCESSNVYWWHTLVWPQPCLGVSSPSWNASAQLVKLCTPQCAWLLKRLAFAEVGELTSSWPKNMNCYRATVVCLDAKGLWKPGQSFILAGFTLSLPRSAPCGTEQTTIDTGCDPALPRNCVDHPADCNLFKTIMLLNSH